MENLHLQSVDTKVLKDERPKPQSKFLTELYAMVEVSTSYSLVIAKLSFSKAKAIPFNYRMEF